MIDIESVFTRGGNMTFHQRKAIRTEYYNRFVKGWKLIKCGACNGSGYYDNDGSPACGCCEGTGKERTSPDEYERLKPIFKELT